MKNILLSIGIALSLCACSNEAIESESSNANNDGSEIQLSSILEGMTRSTDLNLQSTQIVSGQRLGISITGSNPNITNGLWQAGANGILTNLGTKTYWKDNTSTIDITAYQPYMTAEQLSNKVFTVQTDQSTDANYLNSDLLYAKKTASRTTGSVGLTFTHKLSKVIVKLTNESGNAISGAQIYVNGTKPSASFDPSNLNLVAQGTATSIKASTTTSSSSNGAAIVVPQTVAKGTKLLTINYDGATYSYTLQQDQTFDSGRSYIYSAKITSKTEVLLTSYEVIDWNAGQGETGDMTEYIPEPVIPAPAPEVKDGYLYVYMSGIKYNNDWLTLYGDKNTTGTQNVWVDVDEAGHLSNLDVSFTSGTSNIATDIVFLVDNSGSMSQEANAVASQIESWSSELESKGLNVKFGIVGFNESGIISGAINMTSAAAVKTYLDRSTGISRTVGFYGSDATALKTYASDYSAYAECGVMALRMANDHFSFRSNSNRVYILFTDDLNHTGGKSENSIEWVKSNWTGNQGTIHVIYSESKTLYTPTTNFERSWLLADYTGGTCTFTNNTFTGVNLSDLDVSGALTHSYVMKAPISTTLQDGKLHDVKVTVKYPDGVLADKIVQSILPKVNVE